MPRVGLLRRWLLSPRWRRSRFRQEAAALMLLVGRFFGQQPPHIDPVPPEVTAPLERDPDHGPGSRSSGA
ncbi:MAG: hypothetical protein ACREN4_00480 [Candidatus Dormibacteria bacterium]